MPPVTALRSPPDSRTTGADSPVIADSSTEAMPADDVAVAGDQLARGHDHDVAEFRSADGDVLELGADAAGSVAAS